MKIGEIVSFRKDLLFNGAVQIGWFEKDKIQANKAAQHFIFHGPEYHGVASGDFGEGAHKLVDTATFTIDLLERISGITSDEPFALAIAGYGTGKSHLGLTLATLLSNPSSGVARKVINNISLSDKKIGNRVLNILEQNNQPYLVLTLNGMQDFDLTSEIVRQILQVINGQNLDTTVLENLRPRFKTALNFTESFFDSLYQDFEKVFGEGIKSDEILNMLKHQDDDVFCKVNEIFEQKMSEPIRATGQESLHDFIRVTKENYCGEGKPFAGIVIIFDEFGRYLEFSVQKPHIAGSGSLQKLFESVQENGDKVFLLSFIQYELKAYISRVAPELRDDLNRYVTRFDSVRKIRLSTNLETLISNLLEKKNEEELNKQTLLSAQLNASVQVKMKRWFPDIRNYSLWLDWDRFERVIVKGCWPLHPISTWIFYKLTSIGKSLQQRSALSLLADIISDYSNQELKLGSTIVPADLCNESLINEFLSSERIGQQGATAHAYESVARKYEHELSKEEKNILKSVLLTTKIGVKIESKDDYVKILVTFSGLDENVTQDTLGLLEHEYAVLAWNERLRQYEIVDDAVPRSTFMKQLAAKVADIDSQTRAEIFSGKFGSWSQNMTYSTDFGPQNKIPTKEWNYKISYTNVQLLNGQIDYALRSWMDARGVDEEKGQLIYCYVGPDSSMDSVKELSRKSITNTFEKNKISSNNGVPIAIVFLHDTTGSFGEKIAQYWVLEDQLNDEDTQKFSTFIINTKESTKQEIDNLFSELERNRQIVFATESTIKPSRISIMLTQLFDKVYPKRIPFPFDGFHTARGNAAKDSQTFIKELILGNLDREWISARASQQRNRAYFVLVEAWGAIAEDGSLRLKPTQSTIKEIFEDMETLFHKSIEQSIPMNLGAMIKNLCAPPYGCNLASAGMLLALFIGRRKSEINIFKNDRAASFENWLQDAMPGNFLDISVLDTTTIVKITKDAIFEWEALLEDWDTEKLYEKKVMYFDKANALEKRIPMPQQCFYRYRFLIESTETIQEHLHRYDERLYEGKEKIEDGIERSVVSLITWGVGILIDLKNELLEESEYWSHEQINEIDRIIDRAKTIIQNIFPEWLVSQTVASLEHIGRFRFINNEKVAPILRKLGLDDEKEELIQHVEKVEENVRHIEVIKRAASDVQKMVQQNVIANTTPVSVIKEWNDQAKKLMARLKEGRSRTDLARDDLNRAAKMLIDFHENCKNQINSYRNRLAEIFNISNLTTLSNIASWRQEVNSLLHVYKGHKRNTEDLLLVITQLDLIEKHFKILSEMTLSEVAFQREIQNCYAETEDAFSDDAPPLDHESIYQGIIDGIEIAREEKAQEWLQVNLPKQHEIAAYDSHKAMQTKIRLQNMPAFLSSAQINLVKSSIKNCDYRIDELELEGMLTRFESLSDRNKQIFLRKVASFIRLSDFDEEGLTG